MRLADFEEADLARLGPLQPADWNPIDVPLRQYLSRAYCHVLKAELDGELVGTATRIVFGQTAWLAAVITHPQRRGLGVATALVRAHLDALDADGVPTVALIATDLGQGVYRRCGFADVATYTFFGPPAEVASPARSQGYEASWRDRVLSLDRELTGEDRHPWLEPHLDQARLFASGPVLRGFWLPTLGEGLILASDRRAGQSLLEERLASRPARTVVPEGSPAAQYLAERGCPVLTTGWRMLRGRPLAWRPEAWFSRIGGNLG